MFAPDTGNKALLKYTRNGQGYPLILQHGYFGGAQMWQAQIDHFKSRYDVIAPNLAGFGDSSELIAPQSLWQGISDSYLAVIPGCAHNAHMEKPALFNMIVDDFLSD
jgi:pimeloyl-ACP methyl ester carboxylesterase